MSVLVGRALNALRERQDRDKYRPFGRFGQSAYVKSIIVSRGQSYTNFFKDYAALFEFF